MTMEHGISLGITRIRRGMGNPNGVVNGNTGDIWQRTDGNILYVCTNWQATNSNYWVALSDDEQTIRIEQVEIIRANVPSPAGRIYSAEVLAETARRGVGSAVRGMSMPIHDVTDLTFDGSVLRGTVTVTDPETREAILRDHTPFSASASLRIGACGDGMVDENGVVTDFTLHGVVIEGVERENELGPEPVEGIIAPIHDLSQESLERIRRDVDRAREAARAHIRATEFRTGPNRARASSEVLPGEEV